MVGLPARGKTHIARKLSRYLSWLGHKTSVFNVGNYRRERLGSQKSHDFFDPLNLEASDARKEVAMAALDDLCAWFQGGGEIGIYDATNSVRSRREFIRERCEREGLPVIFVESICDDEEVIASNIRQTKLHMPDYAGMAEGDAVADFVARIEHYASTYEPVGRDEGAYVKVIDVGRELLTHRIQGYLPSRLVYFLMNLHPIPRPIYLTRHGESLFNLEGRIGGDSGLSESGVAFANHFQNFVKRELDGEDFVVWTSTLKRTIQTARGIAAPHVEWRALDEIDAGECDGMTYDEIREFKPHEFAARTRDKFGYRYPRGESYRDIIRRLEPVIVELERERSPVVIVAHQAVLRALYAYLMDKPPRDCPFLPMPLHTVLKLSPTTYGCDEERIPLGPIASHDEMRVP